MLTRTIASKMARACRQKPAPLYSMRLFSAAPETYIKEMESPDDWDAAMENRERPVLIQAGANWCQPCVMLKPILTELIKSHEGAVEYLFIDVDKN